MNSIIKYSSGLLFAVTFFCSSALATSLESSLTVEAGFSVAGVNSTSYDTANFNAFSPFTGFISSEIYSVGSFTSGPLGSNLEFFMLSEAAFYDGNHIAGKANNFGVKNAQGDFISLLDSAVADPGSSGNAVQGVGEEWTFVLRSPESDFSSKEVDNADSRKHIIARRVEKDGQIVINNPDLKGLTGPLVFNLLAGDYILFMEDLLAGTNSLFSLNGDFDYNDMVVVVRQSDIPEPGSLLLMSLGLAGLGAVRRKRAAKA
jgi:hypothetical protein